MVKVDGSKEGDTTVTYDKGGWVFWMLTDLMGRERALAGLREFVSSFKDGPDFPVLQDLLAVMRATRRRRGRLRRLRRAVVLRWRCPSTAHRAREDARGEGAGATWEVAATIRNDGTGTMPLEVAAAAGTAWTRTASREPGLPGRPGQPSPSARGRSRPVTIRCDFEPDRVLPDPDVRVLQLNRAKALRRL